MQASAVEQEAPNKEIPLQPAHPRVKCPTVLQMEAVECGAAALSIVLAYFDRIVSLEELRIECGVSRDGSTAKNILRAAKKYGLQAKGFKYELDDLVTKIKYPAILWWNANHFLVLEGFKKGQAYLVDPGRGPRVVSPTELDASFSGVVLTFEKGEEFVPGGEGRNMAAALWRRVSGSKKALTYVLLCGLFLVVPGLVVPTFSRVFVDEYLVAGRSYIVKPLVVGMLVTMTMTALLTYLREYFLLRFETKLALQASSRFFQHVLRLPISYFSQRFAGEISSRVMINDKVAEIVTGRLATTVIDCVMIVFFAGIMFTYDVVLTLLVIFLSLGNVIAVKAVSRTRTDASRRLMADKGKLVGTAMNGITMVQTLKASGGESEFFARWAGYQAKALRSQQSLQIRSDLVAIVPTLVQMAITATILLVGGFKVMNGGLTVGLLVAYQSLTGFFTKPLGNFVGFGSILQELEADMNRLDDVLCHPLDQVYSRDAELQPEEKEKVKLDGRVELREVTFGYSPLDKPLIDKFSLVVEPGQRVALVGGSGSGKSTVARLVVGLFEPWSGTVLLDDVPRNDLPRELISNSVGMVDQEIFLFGGTIGENVTMWDETIPGLAITQACRDAQIGSVVEEREGSYRSMVEEGGGNFSGGQRQRLEIARALVGEPSVLVLDEATSALDPATEADIETALRSRGCTCIIVAHRLSTVRECDEIVVLDRGVIVQRGTHEELLEDADGPYATLIQES